MVGRGGRGEKKSMDELKKMEVFCFERTDAQSHKV